MRKATPTQKGKPLHIETSLVQKRKCVSSLYIHIYTMHGYVIDYFVSFYNLSLCTCSVACIKMHACRHTCMHVVCVLCLYSAYDCFYACLHLSYSCVAYLENDPPTSVAQSQWTRENLLLGTQTKTTFSSLGKWRWQRAISWIIFVLVFWWLGTHSLLLTTLLP